MNRPFVFYPLVLLLLFLSISATFGGVVLMFNPGFMGATEDLLARSPFPRFFLPGLILFACNGVLPFVAAIGLWRKPDWAWANALNLYADRHWAWAFALYSGFSVVIWITVQVTMIQFNWLQPTYMAVGLLVLICTLTPGVMRHYQQ